MVFQQTSWEKFYKQKKQIYAELLFSNQIHFMPGAQALLSKILDASNKQTPSGTARCTSMLVTQSPRKAVSNLLGKLPLLKQVFGETATTAFNEKLLHDSRIITQEDSSQGKPHPEPYLNALHKYVATFLPSKTTMLGASETFTVMDPSNNKQEKRELVEKEDFFVLGFEDSPRGFHALKTAMYEWNLKRVKEQKLQPTKSLLVYIKIIKYEQVLANDQNQIRSWKMYQELLNPLDEHQKIVSVDSQEEFLQKYSL